jgi:iron complex outermembrane recepter protein
MRPLNSQCHTKRTTLSLAVLFALAAPAVSLAQQAPIDPATSKETTKASDASATPNVIDRINVTTARRRGENIQSVPVSVTSISREGLQQQQIADLEGLNLSVPNVTIVRNTGTTVGAQVYIRGVGNDDSGFNIEPPVGIYLDDVYVGRQIGAVLDILDFERIEFVRGPQGTLYGRNSSAGAIKYVSRKPNLNDPSVAFSVSGGTLNRQNVNFSGSLPLADNRFAMKLDVGSRKQDGWAKIVNAAGEDTGQRGNAINNQAGRLSGAWAISNKTDLYFSLDAATNKSGPQVIISTNCTGLIGAGVSPFAPNSAFNVVCPFRFDARTTGNGVPDINKFNGWGSNITLSSDLGVAEFKSITGYRGFKDDLALDLSGNPSAPFGLVQFLKQKQFSEEIQFTSKPGGAFNWIAGAFYFDESIDQDAVFTARRNIDTQDAKSYALFGEMYWAFATNLTLTVGGRQANDKKSINRQFFLTSTATTPTATLPPGNNNYSENKFTPKVGIDYKVNKDLLLYATWGEGYRAGGFAAARPTSAAQLAGTLAVETVAAWEAGVKSEFMNRRLKLNAAYFQSTYKNLQSGILGGDGSFNVISSDAKFSGVDLEAAFRITPNWNAYLIGGLLDDKYTRAPANVPTAVRLKHAPSSQYKIGTDLRVPGIGPGALVFAANYRWTDEIYRNVANSRNILSPAYGLFDAQLAYEWADGKYKITLAGTNLGDKVYYTQGVSTLGRYIGSPRLLSVSFDARF